jgi:2'-5' RNA ligase
MVQALELLLDPASEALVVEQWWLLAAAGLASQALHRGASNRPHVTLCSVAAVPEAAEEALVRLCGDRLPLDVSLAGLAVLGSGHRVTLAWLVAVSRPLLDLHRDAAGLLGDEGPHTAPGRWLPHVTLALRMPTEQVVSALGVLGRAPGDVVRLEQARRWDSDARRTWPVQRDPDAGQDHQGDPGQLA